MCSVAFAGGSPDFTNERGTSDGKQLAHIWQSLGRKGFQVLAHFSRPSRDPRVEPLPDNQEFGPLLPISPSSIPAFRYIGLENYFKLLKEPSSGWRCAFSGADFFLLSCSVASRAILAHLLIQPVPGIHFFERAMITWVLPIIASVVMFRFMTLPGYVSLILLKDVGLGQLARNWFGDETYAFLPC